MRAGTGMERAIDTRGAVAINVITMVGIGPLITIPLVLGYLGGPLALLGWIAGAVVALCDGLVWAELASRFPSSGGTYVYLREGFGPNGVGRALAFLFNWQFLLYAPCLLATGYIGFASYAAYIAPVLNGWVAMHACAAGVGVVAAGLLLRRTARVSATGVFLGAIAVLTLGLIALAALTHAQWHTFAQLPGPIRLGSGFLAGFGGALLLTLYDYVGYADVALLGDEVRTPQRTIPRSIVISVLLVAALYIALQCGVLAVIPWRSLFGPGGAPAAASQYVGSLVVEHTWGVFAARIVTGLVLVTAFASVYGNLLGFSRIPFAAARDGAFFAFFAWLHPRTRVPQAAVLVVGGLSLLASLFTLEQVIQILTAGIVLIQSVMQIFALALLRARGAAPFRMPLYPLPALVALGGWVWAFVASGTLAVALGMAWLTVGIAAYLIFARVRRAWPFALASTALLCLFLAPQAVFAKPVGAWATWHTSRVAQMNGYPVFEVDGKPFFVWGAAFFYERIPAQDWDASLREYRSEFHINTIDLYVPWNWEEPTEGHLDFSGRTNARRNLVGLMRIIHRLGFKVVLRPGPVIRNEWRNGGYPAWLLERPAYNMPLHDVLDGRYPATATLQNQHADAAAQEWLHNPVHLHYAANWLREVLSAIAPWSHDVIAVALDDDQGAYLDNDTWPAPHWHEYVAWLKREVESTAGRRVPVFINTYEQRVTADSPVWAWGDWYQSDAYRIGEHDRDDIDFSTDLLGTQPHVPIMMAEFQAGWLQGASEGEPRPAAPSNTTLALSELLADGVHGVVDFPLQDTINPAGWEAPWANWAYDWDAAITACTQCNPQALFSARAAATRAFGEIVARWGSALAQTHVAVDAHVIWPESLFGSSRNDRAYAYARAVKRLLAACRAQRLTCDLTDLIYGGGAVASRSSLPYVLPIPLDSAVTPLARKRLSAIQQRGLLREGIVGIRPRHVCGNHRAIFLESDGGASGFVVVQNWSNRETSAGPYVVHLHSHVFRTNVKRISSRSATLLPIGHVRASAKPRHAVSEILVDDSDMIAFGGGLWPFGPHVVVRPGVWRYDPFEDGFREVAFVSSVMHDGTRTVAMLAPNAGARIDDLATQIAEASFIIAHNFASTIGLLRDAVDPEPAPSARDYIAAFTHPIPAGTFNRQYACARAHAGELAAALTCSYEAPDIPTGGAEFERTLTMNPRTGELDVTEAMTPRDRTSGAHLKSISGFAYHSGDVALTGESCFGIYDPSSRALGRICWNPAELASYEVRQTRGAAILTLHFRVNHVEMRLGVFPANSEAQARALVAGNG